MNIGQQFNVLFCCALQSKDQTLRGHTDSVDQLCWHPSNPEQFVTASGDKTIRLWDPRTSRSQATINTKGMQVRWIPHN